MAILARASITLSTIRDVSSTIRYYKLQASTASPPTKPTVNPPGDNWITTEPSYTENSTNSLYTTDLTIFTDGDFYYSDVSLSSSYEAAKAAYNKSVVALSQSVEYIVGTQSSSTYAWTGVTTDTALVAGKTIAYKLPYAGTSTSATLNLTLSGGGTTGAKPVYISEVQVTNDFAANSIINMTYDGTAWRADALPSDRVLHNNRVLAKKNISANRFIVGNASGYEHVVGDVTFDLTYPILFTKTSFSSGVYTINAYEKHPSVNFYQANNNTSIQGFTANKVVFLKGTVNKQNFKTAASNYLTCRIPDSADGFCYIPLGRLANNASSSTAIGFFSTSNQLYAYKAGLFGPVSIREAAAAAKTATNYLTDINNAGVFVHESNDSDITPTTPGANGVHISSDVDIIRNGEVVASYGTTARIGKLAENTTHIEVDSDSFDVCLGVNTGSNSVKLATFGETSVIGKEAEGLTHVEIKSDSFRICEGPMIDPRHAPQDNAIASFTGDVITLGKTYREPHIELSTDGFKFLDGRGNASSYMKVFNTLEGEYTVRHASSSYYGENAAFYVYFGDSGIYEAISVSKSGSTISPDTYWVNGAKNNLIFSAESGLADGDSVWIVWEPYSKPSINCFGSPYPGTPGHYSFISGLDVRATGKCSHVEGHWTEANGECSHAEGDNCLADEDAAHVEGSVCRARAKFSHAQNLGNIATKYAQTVLGTYCAEDEAAVFETTHPSGDYDYGNYAVIVGNGTDALSRSNCLTVDWAGNVTALKFRGEQHILWTGSHYMTGNQTANLSELVSEQSNGIILLWSGYSGGAAQNYDWFNQFVPKDHVIHRNGMGITSGVMSNLANSMLVGTKYVYVYDDRVVGNNLNSATTTGSGITFTNAHWVLRAVIGV